MANRNVTYLTTSLELRSNESFAPNETNNEADIVFLICAGIPLSLIVIMTICGNILVLIAVAKMPNLRTTTNYFILNLAVADLLLGLTVLPFSAVLEMMDDVWIFGDFFCNVWAATDVLCCTASIMSLCAISIDRYIGVTKPLNHGTIMSEKRVAYGILCIWVLASTISVVPFFGWRKEASEPKVCQVNDQLEYVFFSATGSFYLPALTILVLYTKIYIEVVKRSLQINRGEESGKHGIRIHIRKLTMKKKKSPLTEQPDTATITTTTTATTSGKTRRKSEGSGIAGLRKNTSDSSQSKKGFVAQSKFAMQKKAAKTLGIVVGVFLACWSPFFIALPIQSLCDNCIDKTMFKIIFWLGYCNSMMNPMIYAASSREFRIAYKKILCCTGFRQHGIREGLYVKASNTEALAAALSKRTGKRQSPDRQKLTRPDGQRSISGASSSARRRSSATANIYRSQSACETNSRPMSLAANRRLEMKRVDHKGEIEYEGDSWV